MVVGSDPNAVYMVMEFMDHELKALMDTMPRPFSTAEVCPLPGRGDVAWFGTIRPSASGTGRPKRV